jgi:hypothetical protein
LKQKNPKKTHFYGQIYKKKQKIKIKTLGAGFFFKPGLFPTLAEGRGA